MKVEELYQGLLKGDRRVLAKSITLIESARSEDQEMAQELLQKCLPHTGKAIRVGISGVPGVGKSTLIESLGLHLVNQKKKLAVLAVDPSSPISGGSLMADKTRMVELSRHPLAFIRPSSTGGHLGGVAYRTREAMILCEANGADVILVETVGVGQSEFAVANMVDLFLLLLLPGGGDELQGIKRGVMELASLICINKADDPKNPLVKQTQSQYQMALSLMAPPEFEPGREVLTCSALKNAGVKELWEHIEKRYLSIKQSGGLEAKRSKQASDWTEDLFFKLIHQVFHQNKSLQKTWEEKLELVTQQRMSPMKAAQDLSEMLINSNLVLK